jgi:A/G-specific adenine glycosylase
MPWREVASLTVKDRGYRVIVSEFMLQQTQVSRVLHKYDQWMKTWPTIDDFMNATLADVLVLWSGLGYNRRAKYLSQALRIMYEKYNGLVPNTTQELVALPGVGKNTAGAIRAYVFNEPVLFIETNIRTVYLHEFFKESKVLVTDAQLLAIVEQTLDKNNPREWYYALMDYGTYIKKQYGSSLQKAASHKKQSVFHGSKRQVRGRVLAMLTEYTRISKQDLHAKVLDGRLNEVLADLQDEGLIVKTLHGQYSLPDN